jgi:hypothetical protein
MSSRRCEQFTSGTRCPNKAAFEFLRSGVRGMGTRWRAVCASCADILRRQASPSDRLRIRPIEVSAEDEAARHRRLDLDRGA